MTPQEPTEQITIDKEEVKFWKKEIEASRKFRKREFTERIKYKTLIEYYEGIQEHGSGTEYLTAAAINEIYPAFESILANDFVQFPTINVKAKNPIAEGSLQPIQSFMMNAPMPFEPPPLTDVMKAALQYGVDHYGIKGEAQLALFDLCFAGFACIEVNHKVIKEAGKYTEPKDQNAAQNLIEKTANLVKSIFEPKNEQDAAVKAASEQATEKQDSQLDDTYINWWNPMDILFDYRAKVFNRSRYLGKEVEMTIAEFKNAYPAFADKIPSSDYKKLDYADHENQDNQSTVKLVELQIKKIDGLYILVVCDSIQEAIAYYKCNVITNGFTVKYGSVDKYGTLYPISRARLAKDSQDELNHYIRVESDTVDRSPRKMAVFEDGLTDSGKTQMKSADIYAIVNKKIPGQVFEPMPAGGQAPETKDLQMLRTDNINKIVGVNELAKSGQSDSKFATQDALKNQSFQSQSGLISDSLRDLLIEVMDGLKDIIMQFWDGEMYLHVTGIPGGDFWYTPEMGKLTDVLLGDYLIDIDIMSARRKNPLQDRSELTELVMGLMNPGIAGFLQSRGYTLSVGLIEEWIKSFGKNPKTVLEKMQPMMNPMMAGGPGGMPPPQGVPPPDIPLPSIPGVTGA